jgi:hypothetical protein
MNARSILFSGALLAAAMSWLASPASAAAPDVKRAAPADAHTVVYARHNPERDYQREYYQDAWNTFREERIAERLFEIVASRVPEEQMAEAKEAWEQVQTALKPINLEALANAEELVFANLMEGPFGQQLMIVRLTEEDAGNYAKGIGNLFELVKEWSDGKAAPEMASVGDVEITTLRLPEKVPYQPAIARVDDLFLISTSATLLKRGVEQLQDENAKSKFDDPRLEEALKKLPAAEDSLTFFDAAQLFKSLRGIPDFMRSELIRNENPGDEKNVERFAKIFNRVIDEVSIIEYVITVEYTEEGQNRSASLGEVSPGMENTILGRALSQGKPFENWQRWVPADATGYSLSTGINCHELYVGIMALVREEFPEAQEPLQKWEEVQDKIEVHLDEDILQAFSGESVSVTLPGEAGKSESVNAMRCSDPEGIRQLLERAVEGINKIPAVQAYGLQLADLDDDELEGFQEVKAPPLMAMAGGARPVIGFHEGWMIIASSPGSARRLIAVQKGDAPSIEGAESLERFDLETGGTAHAASYSDIGASVRACADGIEQAAAMAPMFVGMAAAQAKPEDAKTIQDLIGLLPSVVKVVRKFDFFEQKLSITRDGPDDRTFLVEAVTLVRQPEDSAGR